MGNNITQEFNILEKLQQFAKENNLTVALYKDNKKEIIEELCNNSRIMHPLVVQVDFILEG